MSNRKIRRVIQFFELAAARLAVPAGNRSAAQARQSSGRGWRIKARGEIKEPGWMRCKPSSVPSPRRALRQVTGAEAKAISLGPSSRTCSPVREAAYPRPSA